MTRYADLPLGYANATVIAAAERNGGRILTLDHRHFGVVARKGTIRIFSLPTVPGMPPIPYGNPDFQPPFGTLAVPPSGGSRDQVGRSHA
ncbi:hypothetical protein BH23CHL5_BH23CHL5_01160 [soil metagenome]